MWFITNLYLSAMKSLYNFVLLCLLARLFGSLFYKLHVRLLYIEDTPIETIDQYTFLGVNKTLNELHIINSNLVEFPKLAFRVSFLNL